MSYQTIRNYFVTRLGKLNLQEYPDMAFKNDIASKDKFILTSPEVLNEKPTLVDRFHPQRQISIQFYLKLSDSKTQHIEYQSFQIRMEQVAKEISNPTNFQASPFTIRNIRFDSIGQDKTDDGIEFTMNFTVEDELTYA